MSPTIGTDLDYTLYLLCAGPRVTCHVSHQQPGLVQPGPEGGHLGVDPGVARPAAAQAPGHQPAQHRLGIRRKVRDHFSDKD